MQDIYQCPNCNNEASYQLLPDVKEEYIFCDYCGYSRTIIKDKVNEIANPFGISKVRVKGNSTIHHETLLDENEYNQFKERVSNFPDQVEYAEVSRLIDGEIIQELLTPNS